MKKYFFLIVFLSLIISCKPDEGNEPLPVSADFSVQNDHCKAPCEISFTNSSLNAVSYTWDFGDGKSSTEESPSHSFTFSGNYKVSLIAKGSDGTEATASKVVTIDPESEFITGMDLSYQPFLEFRNQPFKEADGTLIPDLLVWSKDNGVNLVRLRLFHRPSINDPGVSFADVISMSLYAKRVKASGNQLLLDLHYSDKWADPGNQSTPAAWTGLSHETLKDSVFNYTLWVLRKFKGQDALPDMIQIGNETNQGFLWPEGRVNWSDESSWQKYADLINAAQEAVITMEAESGKDIQTIVHYAGLEGALAFFEKLKSKQALFDIVGLSHYAFHHTQNLAVVQQQLRELATSLQKPILIAETSYPFTLEWDDWTNNIVGLEEHLVNGYPATPEGQKQYYQFWVNILKNVPDGLGMGFVWWAPDLVAFDGPESYEGSAFENLCVFDFEYKALPVMSVFREN